jgi:hypothetical protein
MGIEMAKGIPEWPIDRIRQMEKRSIENLRDNAVREGYDEIVIRCEQVLAEQAPKKQARPPRNVSPRSRYQQLPWNQDSVKVALGPFAEIAKAVPNNKRTFYTEAGGAKIGKGKDHPERKWIATYSAIKTAKINVAMVCFIDKVGDEPYFQLHKNGVVVQSFSSEELPTALQKWREYADEAI